MQGVIDVTLLLALILVPSWFFGRLAAGEPVIPGFAFTYERSAVVMLFMVAALMGGLAIAAVVAGRV